MKVEEVFVPMADGARMRTIVHKPDDDGVFPCLFMRTPYPRIEPVAREKAAKAVDRGYAYVFQFCRGTGGSEGAWVPNENERADGIDAIRWLAAQTWCGPIGVHGISYMALTGWLIADSLPEKVGALFLCHYGIDRFLSAYRDGLFRHDILTGWALSMAYAGKDVPGNFEETYLKSCRYRPHVEVDERLWGTRLDWYRDWVTNSDGSAPYWQTGVWGTLRRMPELVRVPTCIVAGWFDHHLEGTLLAFEKLPEAVKARSRLIVGAWNHDFTPCIPPPHRSARAALDIEDAMLDWFDRSLLGRPQRNSEAPEDVSGASVYVVGEDRWQETDSWPPSKGERRIFSLSPAPGDFPDCRRIERSPVDTRPFGTVEFTYDPENPVESLGGETLFVSTKIRGCVAQARPGTRADIITFISGELPEDLRILGASELRLTVSSDAEDTCFTAKLSEVFPNGEAYNLRSFATTLAYRNGARKRELYSPGTKVELTMSALPIAWTVRKGSRIRLDISSSNFPEYSAHSNYPGPWSRIEKTKTARQTLYFGPGHIAELMLPGFG